jgi:hypothetical protein
LHEAAAAAEHPLDIRGLDALDGQHDVAKPVTLLGVALRADPASEGVKVSRVAFEEVHASASVPHASSHAATDRATTQHAPNAHEGILGAV